MQKDFLKKSNTVLWLLEYDAVAWASTDSLLTKNRSQLQELGREWFCFQDAANRWHAVYGKYENNEYKQHFHYVFNASYQAVESDVQVAQERLNKYGRALRHALSVADPVMQSSGVRFNHYIRENSRGNFEVYILPGIQLDGTLGMGGELILEISPDNKIVKNRSYIENGFFVEDPESDAELWLDYTDLKTPTIGSIFYVAYYFNYFDHIFIENKRSYTTLVEKNGDFQWSTVLKNTDEDREYRREKRRLQRQKGKK